MNINELSIEEQIIAVLNVIRPYLNNDGGDIEFVRFDEGVVYVRMLGACAGCMSLDQTLNDGVREILVENIPGVIEVVNIG
jgi:Fe-S cluster biogenesis protein NfuA